MALNHIRKRAKNFWWGEYDGDGLKVAGMRRVQVGEKEGMGFGRN